MLIGVPRFAGMRYDENLTKYDELFREWKRRSGSLARNVSFCGVDTWAEISYE